MEKSERNYWPHAVVISILLITIACGVTIKIALDNPVELDTSYFEKYEQVDKTIHIIQAMQREFDLKYNVSFGEINIQVGNESKIALFVKNKESATIENNTNVEFLLTKPETNSYNQKFETKTLEDGAYVFSAMNIQKKGRWTIQAKVTVDNITGFFTQALNVTK